MIIAIKMVVMQMDTTISGPEHGVNPLQAVQEVGRSTVGDPKGVTRRIGARATPPELMLSGEGMMEAAANKPKHSQ
jgi:hypothetical protein